MKTPLFKSKARSALINLKPLISTSSWSRIIEELGNIPDTRTHISKLNFMFLLKIIPPNHEKVNYKYFSGSIRGFLI